MSNENKALSSNRINLSELTKYSADEIALMKNTVAKNTTDLEFAQFANVCKSTKLNPFTKEIWCIPMGSGQNRKVLMFASRDGWRKAAQQNKNFSSINSIEVRANDEFDMGTEDGEMYIKHSFKGNNITRGIVIGAYAIAKLKDGSKVIEWADFSEYKKNNVWDSHESEMIKKVAEVHALKKVANLSGIYTEEEFNINDGNIINSGAPASVDDNATKLLKKEKKEKEVLEGEIVEEKNFKNEKINKEEIGNIRNMFKISKTKEEEVLKYFKVERLEDVTNSDAEKMCKMINEKIKAKEKEESRASKEMKAGILKARDKKDVGVTTGIPGIVCKYINTIAGVKDEDLPSDIIMLKLDSNRGEFKGFGSYPSLRSEIDKYNIKE